MKAKRFSFAPIPAFIGLSVAALVAWGLTNVSGLSYWIALPIVIGAMLINGIIAEIEDNAPGGTNNRPPPRTTDETPNRMNHERHRGEAG